MYKMVASLEMEFLWLFVKVIPELLMWFGVKL